MTKIRPFCTNCEEFTAPLTSDAGEVCIHCGAVDEFRDQLVDPEYPITYRTYVRPSDDDSIAERLWSEGYPAEMIPERFTIPEIRLQTTVYEDGTVEYEVIEDA